MSSSLDTSAQVGDVLAGKYRVDRVLGVGGMGVVVAATHLQLGQTVALKFIRREALRKPETIARFEHEARAAARLKSEHVARTIDVGRLENGSPYLVMEYLEGHNLAALLQQYGTIAVARACDLIIQACDAMAEAHGFGIVHRDLKPGNLFLASTSHGRQMVKVLDFGISKSHVASGDLSMTSTQDVMGSPGYMSPEQMRSAKNVDGRTDIWSLGVILYELVTGEVPFRAETLTALCLKIAMEPLPPLPALPALAPGFDAVLRRALEKDPALRYQSAAELAHALAPFAHAESRELARRLVAAIPDALSGAQTLPVKGTVSTLDAATGESQQIQVVSQNRPRSRRTLASAVLGAAAAIGIGVGLTWRSGGGGSRSVKAPIADHAPNPEPETPRPATPPSETAASGMSATTADTKATEIPDQTPMTPAEENVSPTKAPTPPSKVTVTPPDAPVPSTAGKLVGPSAAAVIPPAPEPARAARGVEPQAKSSTPTKPTEPSMPKSNELDRAKAKTKPIKGSFDPYSSPD